MTITSDQIVMLCAYIVAICKCSNDVLGSEQGFISRLVSVAAGIVFTVHAWQLAASTLT